MLGASAGQLAAQQAGSPSTQLAWPAPAPSWLAGPSTHLLVVWHRPEIRDVGKALRDAQLRGAAVQGPRHERVVDHAAAGSGKRRQGRRCWSWHAGLQVPAAEALKRPTSLSRRRPGSSATGSVQSQAKKFEKHTEERLTAEYRAACRAHCSNSSSRISNNRRLQASGLQPWQGFFVLGAHCLDHTVFCDLGTTICVAKLSKALHKPAKQRVGARTLWLRPLSG